jgi:hypothetical protein
MSNKPLFGSRPKPTGVPAATDIAGRAEIADKLVTERTAEAPPKGKRLTIDLSEAMHRDLKVKAAGAGITIADAARWFFAEWTAGRIKPEPPRS